MGVGQRVPFLVETGRWHSLSFHALDSQLVTYLKVDTRNEHKTFKCIAYSYLTDTIGVYKYINHVFNVHYRENKVRTHLKFEPKETNTISDNF